MQRRRRSLRTALATAACALLCAPAGAGAVEALPDLVADPSVDRGLFLEGESLLLRFDAYIRNTGPGAAELRGGTPQNGVLTDVRQVIYDTDGVTVSRVVPRPGAVIRYEEHQSHSHYHLQAAARYSLWSEARTQEVLPSAKVGFCLTDSAHVELTKGPMTGEYAPDFCSVGEPDPAGDVIMGISAGWRDVYGYTLGFQWVDVSSLRPGTYWLGADVDAEDFVIEADESNPVVFSAQPSVVPGYVPVSQSLGTVNPFVPVAITLGAEAFQRSGAQLGAAEFSLTRGPACGRITGTAPNLIYTPGRRCKGGIQIEYTVRDGSSPFPTEPPTAGVSFRLGSRRALLKTRARRRGRKLRVRMFSRYEGRLRAIARSRGRRLGACSKRARPGRRVACSIRLRGRKPARVRVKTALRINRRVVKARRDLIRLR